MLHHFSFSQQSPLVWWLASLLILYKLTNPPVVPLNQQHKFESNHRLIISQQLLISDFGHSRWKPSTT